jgi:AraC-like DNA-binding protein
MSIYTTPLQFGYFFALLFAILFWWRGWREERLSDTLLGFVLFFLGMEIQDYTFGFSGISFLWEELDGFPRYFPWIFPASIYFYLKAQINRNFKFKRQDVWHIVPYLVYVVVDLIVFAKTKEARLDFYQTGFAQFLNHLQTVVIGISYVFYFYKSLKLYRAYRAWTETQFSDTELVSFVWLRNFIYLIIAGEAFKWSWYIADMILNLDYYQDWWWHLFTVAIICYVGIRGYAQPQPNKLFFDERLLINNEQLSIINEQSGNVPLLTNNDVESIKNQPILIEYTEWKPKIERVFEEQKIYLEPELSLSDLAQKLKTNTSVLSGAINHIFGKNFNDFVNEYRVEEFKRQMQLPENKRLTLLAVAFDCGFNSKATFNRAFKKFTGKSPKELIE